MKTILSKHRGFPRSVLKPGLAGLLAVFLFTLSPPGRGATILFTTADAADTTPGEDLWQYSYTHGDFTFAAGQGFTVVFDRTLFSQLQSPPPFVNVDWDPISLQPDLALGSNGFYDALALRNAPSLADPFKVKVVWLGTGAPGAQPFTIYDNNFQTIAQGQTTNVPEPTIALLLFSGIVVAGSRRQVKERRFPNRRPTEPAKPRFSEGDRPLRGLPPSAVWKPPLVCLECSLR